MNWRDRGFVILAGAFLFASGAAVAAEGHSASTTTSGASVLEWNARAAQLIVGPGGAAKVPPLGLVDLAIVHTAVYDAVNAIEGFPFRSYAVTPEIPGPASGDAAVAAAGRGTLIALYPGRAADIEAWYAAALATIPDGDEKTNGVSVGEQTAAGILALRADDGRNDGTPIVEPPAAPGVWIRTPPAFAAPQAPWARFITPWNMSHPSQFRPGPPPRLNSRKYRRDLEETRTSEQPSEATRPRTRRTSAASGVISRSSSGTGPGAGSPSPGRSRAWTPRASSRCSPRPAPMP